MTIEMLDTGTILVSLGAGDMRDYRLSFDEGADENAVRGGLTRLMYRVGEVCGLDHHDKSYLVEALPGRSGCLLVISVHPSRRRRRYRIKRSASRMVCVFDTADDLLDYLARDASGRSGYTLYTYRERYVLLPEASASKQMSAQLSEYGRLCHADNAAVARVMEYGRLIASKRIRRYHRSRASSAAI